MTLNKVLKLIGLIFLSGLYVQCHLEKLKPDNNSDADFSVNLSDHEGFAPCKAQFENLSSNGILFEWEFGDGSATSQLPNPIHLYSKPGDYLVTLTITDVNGISTSVTKPVTINIRTFKKLIDAFNTFVVTDIVESRKGQFWVVGSGLQAGVTSIGYQMKADEKGDYLDAVYFEPTSEGVTVVEVIDDTPYFFGNRSDSDPSGPFVYEINPPDLFITYYIEEMKYMMDAVYTIDGSYAFMGNNIGQIFVRKVPTFPQSGWSITLQGSSTTNGSDLHPTADGGVVIAGTDTQFSTSQINLFLTKLNANGQIQWQYNSFITNAWAWEVTQTSDGHFVVCGGSKVVKISSSGNKIWEKTFSDGVTFTGIAPSMDNGSVMVGSDGNIKLIKVDQNGNIAWNRTFDSGQFIDEGRAVKATSDCGFIVLGASSMAFGEIPYLVKTDANGVVQ